MESIKHTLNSIHVAPHHTQWSQSHFLHFTKSRLVPSYLQWNSKCSKCIVNVWDISGIPRASDVSYFESAPFDSACPPAGCLHHSSWWWQNIWTFSCRGVDRTAADVYGWSDCQQDNANNHCAANNLQKHLQTICKWIATYSHRVQNPRYIRLPESLSAVAYYM